MAVRAFTRSTTTVTIVNGLLHVEYQYEESQVVLSAGYDGPPTTYENSGPYYKTTASMPSGTLVGLASEPQPIVVAGTSDMYPDETFDAVDVYVFPESGEVPMGVQWIEESGPIEKV